MTNKFEGLALSSLREAQKASRRPGQDARFIEQASLQAAVVYATLSLNDKLEGILTSLQELKESDEH